MGTPGVEPLKMFKKLIIFFKKIGAGQGGPRPTDAQISPPSPWVAVRHSPTGHRRRSQPCFKRKDFFIYKFFYYKSNFITITQFPGNYILLPQPDNIK